MRLRCGNNKITTNTRAVSDRECVTKPGYGWGIGDKSAPCPAGFYNPGYNTRKCTRCPGGLTTTDAGAMSSGECVAPEGYYYTRGKAVACAKGTFKPAIGNADCTKCPDGFTTELGVVAATSPTACSYVAPGYFAGPHLRASLGTASTAQLCPEHTYRTGEAAYGSLEDTAGLNCTACADNMQTLSPGATSDSSCLTPPGYGYEGSTVVQCPKGTYNSGWNREPCVPCGGGSITTDDAGGAGPDDCKIPAGHGTTRLPDGSLTAAPCPIGTFGRDADVYGLIDVECSKCLEFSTTNTTGATTGAQCLTLPGYGWDNGEVAQCDYGWYSTGNHQDPCLYCGEGYNTSSAPSGTSPGVGASSTSECVIAAGWTADGAGGVKPCLQGFYKSLLGASGCVRCPSGTTTTVTMACAMVSDCDACRPGFGSGFVDPNNPSCAMCGSGYYSMGYVQGGEGCLECPKPDSYTGRMVSKRGNVSPDGCYPEFSTDAATASLHYDYIPMTGAGVFTDTANLTAAGCEALCQSTAGCQYYVYQQYYSGGGTMCSIRDKSVAAANVADGTKSYILFQISYGVYAAYQADTTDWATTGVGIDTFASRGDAVASCNTLAACVGIKSNTTHWQTFAGKQWSGEGLTAKVRVSGLAINPWVADPIP